MKLAASHIAWQPQEDEEAFAILNQNGFAGLEIAPTRLFGEKPYVQIEKAAEYAKWLKDNYSLKICSMQSIWYGKSGNMFMQEREELLQYTKDAAIFAGFVGIQNMVFGSPKNRVKPSDALPDSALDFFKQAAQAAADAGTVLALEANPPIYGTNFLNTTSEALDMVVAVNNGGCRLNLDFGTILINEENIECIEGKVHLINHVHISEKELALVQKREEQKILASILKNENYQGYVSIEMKAQSLADLQEVAKWLSGVFK